jgi:N-succinyldiaminopimelate aminotransferase
VSRFAAERLRPFGVSIFAEMTALARKHGAVNLAQGFPDFPGPAAVIDAARRAMESGDNQYSRSAGHPQLVEAVARFHRAHYGIELDPLTEVGVTCGATEGVAAALLGILDPGDEVVLFEPYYDSYLAMAVLAGATPRIATLSPPDFRLDPARLAPLLSERTKLVVLNTPHNPTGRVFTRAELGAFAELCIQNDVLVLSDEVYEHITFTEEGHIPLATIPGMAERTLTLGSAGKTFSFTGWKIGWSTGPAELVSAQLAAHQFLTFCAATPLQNAVAQALDQLPPDYYTELREAYRRRRDLLAESLETAGFRPLLPEGTYFILADFSALSGEPDRAFARTLCEKHGVAAVPPSVFYTERPEEARSLLRFAFCKERATLEEAARRLARIRG